MKEVAEMRKPKSAEQSCGLLLLRAILSLAALIALGNFLARHVLDSRVRRETVAVEIRTLATQYESNPQDPTPLNAIIEHARGNYAFGRVYAVGVLGDLGDLQDPPAEALPILRRLLRRSDRTTRREAAIALGKYGPVAIDAIPDLIHAMKTGGTDVSWFSALSLGEIGSTDPNVIAALKEATTSRDSMLQKRAEMALEMLQHDD